MLSFAATPPSGIDTLAQLAATVDKTRQGSTAVSRVHAVAIPFTAVGSMTTARWFHTATLLGNGKVLITGGTTAGFAVLNTAELFDPATGTFTTLSSTMSAVRYYHTATLLPNGKVLIAGGQNGGNTATNRADLFDPASNTFTALPNGMTLARDRHTATLLPSGKVLIAGGYGAGSP